MEARFLETTVLAKVEEVEEIKVITKLTMRVKN
jgi:hypothetical protein